MRRLAIVAVILAVQGALANDYIAISQTHGGTVGYYDAFTGAPRGTFQPFGSSYNLGMFVATGDVNGDGIDETIIGAGPGAGPHVRVYDGNSGSLIRSFYAFDPTFKGGVYVGSGDVNNDGYAEILTGTASGTTPIVRVFSGYDNTQLPGWVVGWNTGFAAPEELDGVLNRVFVGGPNIVTMFNSQGALNGSLAPFQSYTGNVFTASGDVNGDGVQDLLAAVTSGAPPLVRAFNGTNLSLIRTIQPFAPNYTGGVSISTGNFDGDNDDDFICGTWNTMSLVYSFDGSTGNLMGQVFQPFGPNYNGGVDVAFGEDLGGVQIKIEGQGGNDQIGITVWNEDLRGDKDGTTPFNRLYTSLSEKFTAPLMLLNNYYFDRWEQDGTPFGGGQRTINVDTSSPHLLTPVYLPGRTLSVGSSNPAAGIPITVFVADENGLKNGTTPFDRIYTQGTTTSLNAPATFGTDKYFMRWNLNGAPWNANRTVSLQMGATDRDLDAIYGTGFNVNVSANQSSVPITVYVRDKAGLLNGITPFSRLYAPGTNASFTAPSSAGGVPFKYWTVNGVNQPTGKRTVTVQTNLIVDISGYFAP